ncbi:MAG: hypothetical protein M0Q44_01835 [Methylobacter sp.]|jgi:hypothetical protein|nr:hypothetical protein [Methylobacter sp.]
MNLSLNYNPVIKSPAPRRGRMDRVRAGVGLFGAPAAWIMQLFLSEPLAAHACYPYQTPLSAPLWESLPEILLTVSLVCLAVALLSGFVAWNSWRQSEFKPYKQGGDAVNTGGGTDGFLARLSVMSSFIFIVAVIFNSWAVLLVPPCRSWF